MKISLETTFTDALRPSKENDLDTTPNFYLGVSDVSRLALLTATDIASLVKGKLAYRNLEKYVEVLRFRFLREDEDGGTLVEITPVISLFGQKKSESLPRGSRIPKEDGGRISQSVVDALAEEVEEFIYKQLKGIVLRYGGEFDALRRFLI